MFNMSVKEEMSKRTLTEVNVIAVACAAMFVPFLVFLNPSIPHDRYIFTSPVIKYIY